MPGYGARYWAERTPPARRHLYPAFRGDRQADVVVIGGGLTGATAAYVLAKGGLDVVLLEADRVAGGGTASGLGAILPEPGTSFREVAGAAGLRIAKGAWHEARHGALEMVAGLKRLGVRCDVAPQGFALAGASGEDMADVRREHAVRKEAGLDAPWLSAALARGALGTATAGAIRMRGGAIYDPVRATVGLVKAAQAAGAAIFEKSEVRRTRFTRKYADVFTASGQIRTRGVYVATGRPGSAFRQLNRHVREQLGFAVVTEPLSSAMRRETGSRDLVIRESGLQGHWTRWLADDRILFAGALSSPVPPRLLERMLVQRTGQLMYELSVRYPVISGLPARWSWAAPIVTTQDGLPWIGPHRNYPFHFFSMAFGWQGDGLAWWSAKAALRYFTGEARRDDQVFGFLR
jgi:glycine/D-amino acid oxidase-like deaminating enzyme